MNKVQIEKLCSSAYVFLKRNCLSLGLQTHLWRLREKYLRVLLTTLSINYVDYTAIVTMIEVARWYIKLCQQASHLIECEIIRPNLSPSELMNKC